MFRCYIEWLFCNSMNSFLQMKYSNENSSQPAGITAQYHQLLRTQIVPKLFQKSEGRRYILLIMWNQHYLISKLDQKTIIKESFRLILPLKIYKNFSHNKNNKQTNKQTNKTYSKSNRAMGICVLNTCKPVSMGCHISRTKVQNLRLYQKLQRKRKHWTKINILSSYD